MAEAVKSATDILDTATKNIPKGSKDHNDVAIIFLSMIPATKKDGDKDDDGLAVTINVYGSERSAVQLLAKGMAHNKTLSFLLKTAVHINDMAEKMAGAFSGMGGLLGIVLGGGGGEGKGDRDRPSSLFEFLALMSKEKGDKG